MKVLLGKKLKWFRQRGRLTQEELAKKMGVDKQKVSRIERGYISDQLFFVKRMLDASGSNFDELFSS